jgi:hypothetical protein
MVTRLVPKLSIGNCFKAKIVTEKIPCNIGSNFAGLFTNEMTVDGFFNCLEKGKCFS